MQAEVDGWLQAAEAADTAEDKAFGADRRGDEMPDWVADKQARLAKIHLARAELEAEAKAKGADRPSKCTPFRISSRRAEWARAIFNCRP